MEYRQRRRVFIDSNPRTHQKLVAAENIAKPLSDSKLLRYWLTKDSQSLGERLLSTGSP